MATEKPATGAKKKQKKRSTNIVSLHGWEWRVDEEFVIERLIGKMVADGGEVPGREGAKVPAGTAPVEPCDQRARLSSLRWHAVGRSRTSPGRGGQRREWRGVKTTKMAAG